MTLILPDFEHPAVKAYDMKELYELRPDIFVAREHTVGAVCDDFINRSHGNTCINFWKRPAPSASTVEQEQVDYSHFSLLDGLNNSWRVGRFAASASFADNSVTGTEATLMRMMEANCYWLAPCRGDYPHKLISAYGEEKHPNLITTIPVSITSGKCRTTAPDSALYAAYVGTGDDPGADSWAAPQPAIVIALLLNVDPTLTIAQLNHYLQAGCVHNEYTVHYCKYGIINPLRSVQLLLGEDVTVPTPTIPTPEEPMTYVEFATAPNGAEWASPVEFIQSGPRGPESLKQGFDGDIKSKACVKAGKITLGYTSPNDGMICNGLGLFTAWDASGRDPKRGHIRLLDDTIIPFEFPSVTERGVEIHAKTDTFARDEVESVYIENKDGGSILQWGELFFLNPQEEPTPEPEPIPEPIPTPEPTPARTITEVKITYSDGEVKTFP